MMIRRIRAWLFRLLSRSTHSHPPNNTDSLPRPTPGEIMAVRILIPAESDRAPSEQQCTVMFRLGYQKRMSEERNAFQKKQIEEERRAVQVQVQPNDAFTARQIPFIAQIHTQHALPAAPRQSPLRTSRLTRILDDFTSTG